MLPERKQLRSYTERPNELSVIEGMIKYQNSRGYCSVTFEFRLEEETTKELNNLGYAVEYWVGYEGGRTKVSW